MFQSFVARMFWKAYTQYLTRGGRWLVWMFGSFAFIGATSLEIPAYVPFCYVTGLWMVALAVAPLARPRATVRAVHSDRICVGEELPIDLHLRNTGRHRASEWLLLPYGLPLTLDPSPEAGVPVPALRPGEQTRVRLTLRCENRGVFTLRGYRLQSSYPLGLVTLPRIFEESKVLIVYPRFTRLARLEIPTGWRYHPGGVALASTLGESFEYIGNREFREGDSVRDIDWRATARLSRPIVREYREEYFLRVAVVLDTHVPRGGAGLSEAFEQAVSVAASVSDFMARQDFLVDVFAAGPDLYHLTAGRSLAYLDQILDILACVEESRLPTFETIEPELMQYLERITTVVCVLLDWDEPRRAFVRRLREHGTGLKVVIVREGRCSLDPAADPDLLGVHPVITPRQVAEGPEEL